MSRVSKVGGDDEERCMTRISNISRTRKIATVVAVLGMLGGGIALATGTSNAAESCQGLDTALQNNLNFIAGQQANPDANSAGRIANRQAVVDLIEQRRQAAGCNDGADENNADEQGNDGANGDAEQADEGQADQGQADEDQADQGDD